jgi:hypothetical protein
VDGSTVQDLQSIRKLKVYFGHQSVGENILEGLREIEKTSGPGPLLSDAMIGQNGDPEGKCEDFTRKMAALAGSPSGLPDVALMKFCFVDFNPATDPARLFQRYAETVDSLQAKYPAVTLVPVTAPLTTASPLWKRLARKLTGGVDAGSAANANRAEFNRLLTAHYAGRTIFDLARVESTQPDGSRSQFEWSGQPAYSLVDAYSSDGGHLNEAGKRLAAEELIHTLAAAARARSARVSPPASASDSTSR